MYDIIKRLLLLILLVIAIVFILQKTNLLPSWKDWFKSKPVTIDDTAVIITEIKNIAELTTMQMYAEIVVDSVENTKLTMANDAMRRAGLLSIPFLEADKLVLIVKGHVKAGVNLKKMKADAIYTAEDSISIAIPESEILDIITNPSGFETFAEDGDWSDAAVLALKQKAREQLIQKAREMQLLQKADARAKAVIEELLRSFGFEKIHITNT